MAASALPGPTSQREDCPTLLAPSSVVPVSRDDVAELAGLAAATTVGTPVARWLVPDPRQRPTVLRAWYQLLLEQALGHGRVDLLADRSAVAVWIDRTGPAPALQRSLRRLTSSCGKHAITLLCYHHLLRQHRPAAAHLELSFLAGTHPGGLAGLLAHRHRRLDPADIAGHAIAGSPAQRDLLAAAGYQAGHPFRPAAGPQLWPMWRPAVTPHIRPAASARA
ncbi:hypothetical protein [Actinoplanes sp. NPDC026619]|uniref:hypothetical protein n=1 Tax=Actinoplanes sp. NPDC026619 TaxID=3155798 RepID=UPI0033FFA17D